MMRVVVVVVMMLMAKAMAMVMLSVINDVGRNTELHYTADRATDRRVNKVTSECTQQECSCKLVFSELDHSVFV